MNTKYSKPSMEFHQFYVEDHITSSVTDHYSISAKTTAPLIDIVNPDPSWDD